MNETRRLVEMSTETMAISLEIFPLFGRTNPFSSHSDTQALVTMLAMASNVTGSLSALSSSIVKQRIPLIHCASVASPSKQRNGNLTLTNPSNACTVPTIRAQASIDYIPDSKFYKIEAVLRPWRIQNVSSALLKIGIRGVTVYEVRGFGAQGGSTERHGGSEFSEDNFVAKIKMEIVVSKDQVEAVIEKIIEEGQTGEIGDGKIFVVPVADVIRVRTGERGEKAERMTGGRSDIHSAS